MTGICGIDPKYSIRPESYPHLMAAPIEVARSLNKPKESKAKLRGGL